MSEFRTHGPESAVDDELVIEAVPLRHNGVSRYCDTELTLCVTFNRRPTDEEMRAIQDLPPSPQIARDAQHFAERTLLAELAVRLFRTIVLGGVIVPESPAAMTWLRAWIDGTDRQGPMGTGPMLWPNHLPTVAALMRQWGFQPTPSTPAYVMRRPGVTS